MVALGHEASIELGRHLGEEELAKIGEEIARLGPVPREQSEIVLDEFCAMLDGPPSLSGGAQFAERLVAGTLSGENAERVLDRVRRVASVPDTSRVTAIRQLDPQALAAYLRTEHPQAVAVIAANLETQQAGPLLMALPVEMRAEVVRRMAKVERVSPEVLARIADLVGRKVQAQSDSDKPPSGGLEGVAEVLSSLGDNLSDQLLAAVESADPSMAANIRQLIFGFEDIVSIDQRGMKALLGKIDRKLLTLALKGASEKLRTHFTQCMSQRGAEMLREDMDALGPVRIRDVEGARRLVIDLVKKLQGEGTIAAAAAAEDSYVV